MPRGLKEPESIQQDGQFGPSLVFREVDPT